MATPVIFEDDSGSARTLPLVPIQRPERSHSEVLSAYKVALMVYKATLNKNPSVQVQPVLGNCRLLDLIEDAQAKKTIWDVKSMQRRIFKHVQPLLSFISRHTTLMDSVVQVHPMPTAIIWGGIKLILRVVEDYTDYHNDLLAMLEELGERFERLHLYVKIFDHQKLSVAVLDACIHLLSLLSMINGIFTQKGLWRSMENDAH